MWVPLVEPEMGVHYLTSVFLGVNQDLTNYFAVWLLRYSFYHHREHTVRSETSWVTCFLPLHRRDESLWFIRRANNNSAVPVGLFTTRVQVPMLKPRLQVQPSLTQIVITAGGRQLRHVSHSPADRDSTPSQLVVWEETENGEKCVWAERRGAGEDARSEPRCISVHWILECFNNSEK